MCDQQVAGFISAPRNHAAALLRDVKTDKTPAPVQTKTSDARR
jgi:hypothetical protein